MVHYSVLVPVPNATNAMTGLLEQLGQVFERLLLPYEIICIDDGSAQPLADVWHPQTDKLPLRVLRFDEPRGASAALTAGIAAARGDLILGLSPAPHIPVDRLPHLISRLSRFDFVVARPREPLIPSLRRGLIGVGRLLRPARGAARGAFVLCRRAASRSPGCRCRVAALRVLPELVARRGFRVCQLNIAEGMPPRGDRLRSGWLKRITAAWLGRAFEPHLARELARPQQTEHARVVGRADLPRRRADGPLDGRPG